MTPLLEARGVHAGYPGRGVLHGVDLAVGPGEIVGLIGPNGAGKSTLLAVLTKALAPRAGSVALEGRALASLAPRTVARHVAVVPQAAPRPEGYRVREVVAMGRTPHLRLWRGLTADDLRAVDDALARTRTDALAERRVEELSSGEWQRVLLARAFAQGPRVLLLDEPTSHLDLRYQQEVGRAVRSAARDGLAVVWVIHDVNEASRHCARLVVLHRGRVVADDAPAAVLAPALLARVYEAELDVLAGPEGPIVRLRP